MFSLYNNKYRGNILCIINSRKNRMNMVGMIDSYIVFIMKIYIYCIVLKRGRSRDLLIL